MTSVKLLFAVALLLPAYLHVGAAAKRYGITVAPDDLGLPAYQTPGLFRRKATPTCSFGRCGNDCLDQGAFCCNPAGPDKPDPNWVCDNGICITSIRGSSGIVDCYDPDNPSGTTQSCIDNIPTTACRSTDKCYTCSTDVPFCHWETYVDPASTLSWFECVSSHTTDATYFATTITGTARGTASLPSATNGTQSESGGVHLPTGAIVGIAVGGTALLIFLVLVTWWIIWHRRNKRELVVDTPPTPERAELPPNSQVSEMADTGSPRGRHYSPKKSPVSHGYPSPKSNASDYHTGGTLSPGGTLVAELPALEQVPRHMEATRHVPSERPFSFTPDDDTGLQRRRNHDEY